jgi:hypothetical protein
LRVEPLATGPGVEAVFPDSVGGWRDPTNVRRVWRQLRDELEMTQDRYLGRRLTDRETADVLEGLLPNEGQPTQKGPKVSLDHKQARTGALACTFGAPRGNRTPNPLIKRRM